MKFGKITVRGLMFLLSLSSLMSFVFAQAQPPRPPQVTSPEVQADRHITFRILASQADKVRLGGGDIPGMGQGKEMTKGENGVWEITIGPIDAGAYRYNFNVNGVTVIDPRNPSISESNNNVWSLVNVPGSENFDTKNVPHGAVSAVTYYSTALGKFRRMHVYTPPGYESGKGKYPIFYLLHGAGDSDEAWTSVGRAGFILDNLIAAGKAKPMVMVMPAGHTSQTFRAPAAAPAGTPATPPADEFVKEFTTDIMPYAEKNYRVLVDRSNRAIAGLSMGGSQTLNIAMPHLEKFAYVGVYSSGLLSAFMRAPQGQPAAAGLPPISPAGEAWVKTNQAKLDDANLKKGLKLFWFATGKEDFLLGTTKSTLELFKKHGFNPTFQETAGGHTWINWRNYLTEFAPQLFNGR
jgi:enterochelin esterase-like enzyme